MAIPTNISDEEAIKMTSKYQFKTDDYAVLENCWSLPPKYNNSYLDMCISFQASVADFLDMVEPATGFEWKDTFHCEEISRTPLGVSYFRCSRNSLITLARASENKQLVTFQLRASNANKFRCCLVRLNDAGFREHQQKPARFIYFDTLGHLIQEHEQKSK